MTKNICNYKNASNVNINMSGFKIADVRSAGYDSLIGIKHILVVF